MAYVFLSNLMIELDLLKLILSEKKKKVEGYKKGKVYYSIFI